MSTPAVEPWAREPRRTALPPGLAKAVQATGRPRPLA